MRSANLIRAIRAAALGMLAGIAAPSAVQAEQAPAQMRPDEARAPRHQHPQGPSRHPASIRHRFPAHPASFPGGPLGSDEPAGRDRAICRSIT